ncbi:MAG: RNA methyltransferase [Phormidesmis sp.]
MSQLLPSQIALNAVRIVLVSPAGPLNVGSVARVMKNFGLSQLVLVDPQCDPLGESAMQMAVHAKDVLAGAQRVKTIPEALVGCYRAIATTARPRGFNAPLELPENALPALLAETLFAEAGTEATPPTALIFGPEDRGLSNEELTYAQQFVKVPTDDGYSALNLAQAVAICCYELYRASQQPRPASLEATKMPDQSILSQDQPKALRTAPLSAKQTESGKQADSFAAKDGAKLDQLEGYYQHLEQVLLSVGYLYPHTAASRMRKFRQLLHRATPTADEVALLRGILRQVEWSLSDSQKG